MRRFVIALTWLFGCLNSVLDAQGVLIAPDKPVSLPRPALNTGHAPFRPPVSGSYKIKQLRVDARIVDQVARVQVSQTFANTGTSPMEVQFLFPLPYESAIDQLTLLVDGKEWSGRLLPATEARSIYESIVRSNRDPALLEWIGSGLFQTRVFPVPVGTERVVTLNYNQLLKKDHGLTDFAFPLSTAKYTSRAIENVEVRIAIESTVDLKNIYSPTQTVDIKRTDARHAVVSYSRSNDVPVTDFRLLFDVGQGAVGANVISYKPKANEDGYFLMLASPEVKSTDTTRIRKTLIFVVDRSGSMSGKKFEQACAALRFVLNNLHEGDLFNIIAYDGTVESFRPELEKYNDETRRAALGFVQGLHAGGGTNIQGALTTALSQLKDTSVPNYVLFLTDGLPTVGVVNEAQLCQSTKAANQVHARILTFGVGYDVNARLLDRIARDGFGLSESVRPDEDIEAHVSTVYRGISSPVLTNATVQFQLDGFKPENGPAVNRTYPHGTFDLFEGQQLVIVGRYQNPGHARVQLNGQVNGQPQSFEFSAMLNPVSDDQNFAFIEKLWGLRRIGEIIDQIDLSGKNDELVKELVELSTRHGILTPYTSFLADETVRPSVTSFEILKRTNTNLQQLEDVSGVSGVTQRSLKSSLQNAANSVVPAAPVLVAESQGQPSSAATSRSRLSPAQGPPGNPAASAGTVRQHGNQGVYLRRSPGGGKQILVTTETAEVDLERDKGQIEFIERYSDSYFTLIKANSVVENQILSQQGDDEQLLLKLRGKLVLIR